MDRTKTLSVILILVQQLRTWIKHARDLKHMTRDFKYLSGILLTALDRFHNFFFAGFAEEDDVVYEHSVKVSEIVEKLLAMEEDDVRRVMGLVDKIKRERERDACNHDYVVKFGAYECQNCGKEAA